MSLTRIIGGMLLTISCISCAIADSASDVKDEWITLGTMGGPIPHATHSQPSNALFVNGHTYIVDAGDGTVGQLTKAGLKTTDVDAVFISHLHFDHTGGLPALLSLRWQVNAGNELTVYGPPGIKETVDGIFAFMKYGAAGHYGVPGQIPEPANRKVNVVELTDGDKVSLEDFTLTAVRNTHFSWPEGSDEWKKYQALSFKFELEDYTVVYTGDTGPSKAVELLAKNADMLISEMMDVEHTVNLVKRAHPHMPAQASKHLSQHLSTHHLTSGEVGQLAANANVKKVVITHMAPGLTAPAEYKKYSNEIAAFYQGDITLANDLDRFLLQR
ncbi:beta-lactamase-like protein [Paraglaciecola sp. T6c]|uniref:Beta-lactamase-like protein n=2 Tax=Pseudoalteromonas atlantica (strain T6c / ATCC BAA-1087) TaxID=3042615 RepID=A0ACD6B8B6_PSEA6|nr:MBL fold metallo-hydrolase [Paraglaciecola sp. T6c]ABG39403.1 beta-lactamase-like protein [Paraglaciecola sp. T6c]